MNDKKANNPKRYNNLDDETTVVEREALRRKLHLK